MNRHLARLPTVARSRASVTVADQILSSTSNFAFLVVAAKMSSVPAFGALVIGYVIYGLALGVQRAVGGEVLLLRAEELREELPRQMARLMGVALALGCTIGLVLTAGSVLVTAELEGVLVAVALCLPALLAQDAFRYAMFADKAHTEALRCDALWAVIAIAVFAGALMTNVRLGPETLIAAWGLSALVAAAVGLRRTGLRPRFDGLQRWVTHDRRRVVSFFADFVLTTGSAILAIGVIGLIAGLPAVAATQGAQLLFAPFAALVSGARIILLPLLGAAALRPLIALRRIVGQASLALYGLAALWGGLVLLMPDTLGRAFLGPTWAAAEPLVPWIALYWVIRTGGLPALDGLRALGGGRPLIAVRGVTGVLILLSAVVGSSLGGALGAAIGLSIVLLVAVVLWCAVFIRVTRPRLS